jgi:hypothetical protein
MTIPYYVATFVASSPQRRRQGYNNNPLPYDNVYYFARSHGCYCQQQADASDPMTMSSDFSDFSDAVEEQEEQPVLPYAET